MKLLICGSRNMPYTPSTYDLVKAVIQEISPTVIIHGAASGADTIADNVARQLNLNLEIYPANGIFMANRPAHFAI